MTSKLGLLHYLHLCMISSGTGGLLLLMVFKVNADARMVQWQDLRLPRAGPGFNSRCAQRNFNFFVNAPAFSTISRELSIFVNNNMLLTTSYCDI